MLRRENGGGNFMLRNVKHEALQDQLLSFVTAIVVLAWVPRQLPDATMVYGKQVAATTRAYGYRSLRYVELLTARFVEVVRHVCSYCNLSVGRRTGTARLSLLHSAVCKTGYCYCAIDSYCSLREGRWSLCVRTAHALTLAERCRAGHTGL